MSIAAPWLAVGVGVAGVLVGGVRLWPAFFVGSWVVWGVIVHYSPVSVTVDAMAEAGMRWRSADKPRTTPRSRDSS